LRDGRLITTTETGAVARAELIRWMVGRDVSEEFPPRHVTPGREILHAEHISAPPRIRDASVAVAAGEIVGFAGLVGAGRTSTALAIAGALEHSGSIRIGARPVRFRSPAEGIAHGVAYVTEDRKGRGIFPAMSTRGNLTLTALSLFTRSGVLSLSREGRAADEAARQFDVRAATLAQPVMTLSGGNQQKVLLARATMKRPVLLLLDEPTRGVDVGARAEIYALMNRLSAEGMALLMISSDLPEVLGMSDRVTVMREGRTVGTLGRSDATPERVMALATAS
jgi:ABC-type sugar transport system ATPase subunit